MANEDPMKVEVPQIKKLFESDGYLHLHEREIRRRYGAFKNIVAKIDKDEGGLAKFTGSYKEMGMHVLADNSMKCLEWAPGAEAVYLRGDFNDWNQTSHPYKKLDFGKWELKLPAKVDGSCPIDHLSKMKLVIRTKSGELVDRLSPWARYVVQPVDNTIYDQVHWNPPKSERHVFKSKKVAAPTNIKIYEAHVGIASPEYKVASYDDFRLNTLPHIKKQGYNAIQFMAVMEHAYYASFGYQVTSYFAASSRYGTPEGLKRLVDACHELGIYVLLDIIHSHSCQNVVDGLNEFDGTKSCFFHEGGRGTHSLWDSRLSLEMLCFTLLYFNILHQTECMFI